MKEAALNLAAGALDELDLRVWTRVIVYGLRIGLWADSNEGLDDLKSTLPPGAQRSERPAVDLSYGIRKPSANRDESDSNETIGYLNDQVLAHHRNRRQVLLAIERHVQLHVAEHAPQRVFIHAGVVAWKGRGVVIPGRTLSGKSTLVAALLQAGATYYSDEFAVVDPLGRIHPYPQQIHLRDANGRAKGIDPAQFRARVGRSPLKAGLILVTRHRKDARWRPRRISPGECLLALLANTISARRDPQSALRSLTRMLVGADLLRGSRGEAESLVGLLLNSGYLPQ